jgi:hypothetical protein
MNDILNTCRRFYLQQMLMLGNFVLDFIRFIRTSWKNMIDLSRPYVLMAYDCMGIHYSPVPGFASGESSHWHLIVSMRHPEVGDIPVDSKFENALNTKIPAKASDLICKYADIPIESDMNIDDILVEIMNGDGEIRGFRGDDIINRF